MQNFISNTIKLFKKAIADFMEDKATRQAAAIAYYGVLSLAPLLIIAISVAGIFFGRSTIQQQVVGEVQQALGAESADLVSNVLSSTYSTTGGGLLTTIVSVLLLLMAASNIFFQLKLSLNRIWEVEEADEDTALIENVVNLLMERLLAAAMVIGLGVVLLGSQVLSTAIPFVISAASDLPVDTTLLLQVLNTLASLAIATLVIAVIFRFLPDNRIAWGDILIGSLFTAVLFSVGQYAISLYLQTSSVASAYGVAGSLIVILLWIYYSSSILLFGAEFTQTYARMFGSLKESQTERKETDQHKQAEENEPDKSQKSAQASA